MFCKHELIIGGREVSKRSIEQKAQVDAAGSHHPCPPAGLLSHLHQNHPPRGGRLLASVRDSPPPSRSGPKAPGGGGGGGDGRGGGGFKEGRGGGAVGRVGWGGGPGGEIWGGEGGAGGHRLPLPPLALPLTIPSP